ncbi:serine/threonine-protein kinase [Cryptosporangium aurantiacum]|uniref:non-specific serine/threonine protein kinase n=1 Tax=Cryptosporangium aurantiacum TaxID=134849 RepID=A0A1M7RDX0_9ACTN|nr:serine/threonine-protein kinase [Cryptosporangium aurantiacum]SHN44465.1 Serine/threonine protein kinase [Cryptosporangium aurantiacum]
MWQQGDHQAESALLGAEIRSVRTELDEVTARQRGALDRTDVVSLVLMVVGLAVFASVAVVSYASGQDGRGQTFGVLTLLAVPLVVVGIWRSVGRYLMLRRRVGRIRRREAQLATRLETLGGTVPPPGSAEPTAPIGSTASAPTVLSGGTPPATSTVVDPAALTTPAVPTTPTAQATPTAPTPPTTREPSPTPPHGPPSGGPPSGSPTPGGPAAGGPATAADGPATPGYPTTPNGPTPSPGRSTPVGVPDDGRPSVADAIAMLESALPAYAVRRELGQGGCGMVFLAEHRQAGWLRALKLLTETELVPDSQSRFLREAQVMESLDHPHVARVYEYVEHAGFNLIVMEFLSGGSAAARRAELLGRPGPICAIGLAVADALAVAHSRGVVHRDIKPGNLLFAEDGAVKVTDFGIAKLLAGGDGEPASILALTPGYAAPEQLNADEITARTDLYGLAATLYRMFSGQTPPLPSANGTPRARMGAIPPGIAAVLERSLNGFPEQRHPDAMSFALDLATASAAALRPGWLDDAGVPFRGAAPIRRAADA